MRRFYFSATLQHKILKKMLLLFSSSISRARERSFRFQLFPLLNPLFSTSVSFFVLPPRSPRLNGGEPARSCSSAAAACVLEKNVCLESRRARGVFAFPFFLLVQRFRGERSGLSVLGGEFLSCARERDRERGGEMRSRETGKRESGWAERQRAGGWGKKNQGEFFSFCLL